MFENYHQIIFAYKNKQWYNNKLYELIIMQIVMHYSKFYKKKNLINKLFNRKKILEIEKNSTNSLTKLYSMFPK